MGAVVSRDNDAPGGATHTLPCGATRAPYEHGQVDATHALLG